MATFEEIQKANQAIETMDVKGKEYAMVNQRIKAFRMVYPMGYIRTEMLSNEDGVCVFRAEVGVGDFALGTGTAYEKESSSYINKTSYIENCETSAVGRALGMAGFGIDTSVASYEEVANAVKNQERKKASKDDISYILANCSKEEIIRVLDRYHIGDMNELEADTAAKLIMRINERKMTSEKA